MIENKALMDFTIQSSLAMGQFEEAEKRIAYCPFDANAFKWRYVYDHGPHFFVMRDLLRRIQPLAKLVIDPRSYPSLDHTLIVTSWSQHRFLGDIKVRGQWVSNSLMPLYVEDGEWECPQMNPLFDWNEAQAWAYLLYRQLVTP
jgi:hypothetical protein